MLAARDAVRARDAAAEAAGRAFVDAAAAPAAPAGPPCGAVPPLALVSHASRRLLDDAGEGTLGNRSLHWRLLADTRSSRHFTR